MNNTIKKGNNISDRTEQNKMLKEYNNHIQNIFEKFKNDETPVNIIKLCEFYKWKPLFADKNGIASSFIITKQIFKSATKELPEINLDEYNYFLLIFKDKPIKQRLNIAILFSALYMAFNKLCSIDEFESSVVLGENIDTESPMYKFAILLLCPKIKLEELIRESGFTPTSLLNTHSYKIFVEEFLISPFDFEYRLNLLISEGV